MSQLDIQEVINELGLRKGKNKGEYTEYYCPVHDTKTPDLAVYQDDFACYSGGRSGGNAISLLMHCKEMNSIEEAMEWIQDHFPEKNVKQINEEKIEKRNNVREALNNIAELAHSDLKNQHQELYEFIKENRAFCDEVMRDSKIGFISNDLVETIKSRYSKEILLQTGLFYEKDGNFSCQMWNRIVFPYIRGGQVWYMIGRKPDDYKSPEPYRSMLENSPAKYKKLKKTEFNKHIVYQWQQDKENKNTVIITEGITDAISAHKAGYNVSSPVTTKYSDKDINRVCNQAKHFNNVYICMDADEEGRKGAKKTAHELAKHGIEAKIIDLETGDLDDYTTEHGYDLQSILDNSERYIDILNQELEDATRGTVTEKKHKIFDAIKNWDKARRVRVLSNLSDGTKGENKEQFKEWFDKTQNSEQTEQTEQTEGITREGNLEGDKDLDKQDYLERLASQEVNKKQRLAGKVNGKYFFTAWIEEDGLERPAVVTEDNMCYIKHKLKEKQRELGDDMELSDEQKEKYDYWYATIGGKEVKFQHEIPKKSKQAIHNLDNTILKYITGKKKLRDPEKIFDDAIDLLGNYWSHYHDEWYDISIAYNFHTYLLPELGYTVYILLKGRPQTGKTTWQKVNSQLNYNGCFAGNLTPATAVRYAHSYFATLHQDEMEKQSESRRNQMQGLYNTGQRKGGVYNITNTDAGTNVADQIQEIQSFCAKSMSVNDIFGFADSFMSRNVIMKTVKTKEKGLKDPDSMSDSDYKRFKELQAEMAYYVMKNHDDVLDSIEQVRNEIEDTARDEDKIALFKGLVQHFKGSERAGIVEERIRDSQRMQEVSKVGERVTLLFEDVSSEFKMEDSKLIQPRASDLADNINDELGLSQDAEYKATSKSIIKMLKEYDIMRRSGQKKKDSSGYTVIEIELNQFLDACDRYEMSSIYEDLVTDSSKNSSKEENVSSSQDTSTGVSSQSAQSAQSAQSQNVKAPTASQIKRKIREWQEDSNRETRDGVDLSDLEEYFVNAYSDHEKVRNQFVKQPDAKSKSGIAKLLHQGEAYQPSGTSKIKLL